MLKFKVPVLGFAAYSGTGKTTLLVKLIPLLREAGIRVALIKHAHHDFDIDIPGKDSYELRKAGADQVLVASAKRRALIREMTVEAEPQLEALVNELDLEEVDLVLVEGFRHVAFPKIELHRPSMNRGLICMHDDSVIAVASDEMIDTGLPLLDINQPEKIARFIQEWMS
jgi:molybdopterin-guanine dinucleotide biosynthesis protein B